MNFDDNARNSFQRIHPLHKQMNGMSSSAWIASSMHPYDEPYVFDITAARLRVLSNQRAASSPTNDIIQCLLAKSLSRAVSVPCLAVGTYEHIESDVQEVHEETPSHDDLDDMEEGEASEEDEEWSDDLGLMIAGFARVPWLPKHFTAMLSRHKLEDFATFCRTVTDADLRNHFFISEAMQRHRLLSYLKLSISVSENHEVELLERMERTNMKH